MRPSISTAGRRALEQRVAPLRQSADQAPLIGGWIRATREALGMSATQFAARCGITRQEAQQSEQNEVNGTIRLATLQRSAEALGCRLVYAFVPDGSLDDLMWRQERALASSELAAVDQTMLLEDQRVDENIAGRRVGERADELLYSRRLWDSLFRAMKSMLLWRRAIADGGGSDESSDHHRRVCVHARKIPRSLAHGASSTCHWSQHERALVR